jgi:hypothetical protein
MTETEAIRISRLNDSNYPEWAIRMQAVLIRRSLWTGITNIVVDEEGKDEGMVAAEIEALKKKRKVDKMDEACAEMVLRVDDGQLSHMRSNDPREVWQTLRRVHLATGFATSLALRRKFLTAKKVPMQSMQAWIGHIKSLAFRMEEAGIDVSDQDRILALTMGLPDAYDAVIINFDATPPEQLTLNHVITRLLNEETRQSSTVTTGMDTQPTDEAMAATEKTRRTRAPAANPYADVTCYFCDEKGHYKSDCPERKEWEKMKGKKKKTGIAVAAVEMDSDSDSESSGAF